MSRHKLQMILDNMMKKDLHGIYNCFWKDAEKYNEDDLRLHIARYVVTLYKLSAYKHECKEKCYFLIKQIEDYERK